MCGIAGWKFTEDAPSTFGLYLAYSMDERGGEAFGFFDGAKVTKGKWEAVKGLPARVMTVREGFLHTRFGTQGGNTVENAHPYTVGKLIGAHNGTLSNHATMNTKHARKCEVDSMHIFEHLSAGLPLTDLEGYGAIEYFEAGEDGKAGTYYVGCCNGGALEIALTNLGVVWASTREAIRLAVENSGLTLVHFYTVEEGKQYRVESDCLYETDRIFNLAKPAVVLDWKKGRKGNGGVRGCAHTGHMCKSKECVCGCALCLEESGRDNARLSVKDAMREAYSGKQMADFDGRMMWERDLEAMDKQTESDLERAEDAASNIFAGLSTIIEDDSLDAEDRDIAKQAYVEAREGKYHLAFCIMGDYFGEDYADSLDVSEDGPRDFESEEDWSQATDGGLCGEPAEVRAVCEWCEVEKNCVESFGVILCGDCIKICN